MVIASNKSIMELFETTTYPVYYLSVLGNLGAMFTALQSPTDSTNYFSLGSGLVYDGASFTLTATDAQLMSMDLTTTVTANGTPPKKVVNLQPNKPEAALTITMPGEGMVTMSIAENGTYTGTQSFDDTTEVMMGTWSVSGNQLALIETYIEDSVVVTDTTYATYSLKKGKLTITMDEDACEGEDPVADCLREIEEDFRFPNGSLTAVTQRMVMTFSKSVAKLSPELNKFKILHREDLLYQEIFDRLKHKIKQRHQ
jgi:hypothetical protein